MLTAVMFSLSPLLFPWWMHFLNSMSKSIRLQQMDCDDMRQTAPRVITAALPPDCQSLAQTLLI